STPPDSSAGSSWKTVSGTPASVHQHEMGAAVRALRLAAVLLDRQVDARVRIPQRHCRCRAAQRQLRAMDLVTLAGVGGSAGCRRGGDLDRKSTRLNSSHVKTSYAVFC